MVHEAMRPLPLGNGLHPRRPQRLLTRTVAVTDFLGSAIDVAVTPTDPDGTARGAVYVALAIVTFVTLPHADAPPEHPVMVQVTPADVASFVTVAAKFWLPPAETLTVTGETVTEIVGPVGGSVAQAETRTTPASPKAMQVLLL